VIAVDDIAAASEKVRRSGGEVLGAPMEIPGVGQYVSFTDPEGNASACCSRPSAPASRERRPAHAGVPIA
jgi:predicted enzyme related to lactoylglutathione lyase